jgi:hypothetical protein
MKNYLLLVLALLSFNAFASGTLNFSAKGKDLASAEQKELFHENLRLRDGQAKKIPVGEWSGRANTQELTYEINATKSPVERNGIRATVKTTVLDTSGFVPVELFTETKSIDFNRTSGKSLVFEVQQNGVMLNQEIEFQAK